MNYQKILEDNEISKFEDVSQFLEANNIKVKQDKSIPDLYLVYFERNNLTYNELSPLQKECNGAIYEKNTNKLVCACFNKFNKDSIVSDSMYDLNDKNLEILPSINGTLIRTFYYKDTLYFATKKCINANHAYWSSKKSFGQMFQECLDVYKDKISLDNFSGGYNHFFIMQHLENDNILPIPGNNLVHISTFNLNKNEFKVQYFGISKPQFIEIRDKATLEIMIHKKTINFEGYVLFNKNEMGLVHQKIIFPSYINRSQLYGNTRSRLFRFLEIQNNVDLVRDYLDRFPNQKDLFYEYEQKLLSFCKNLHETYLNIRVKKIPNYDYNKKLGKCLYTLHGLYLKHHQPITLTTVVNYIKPLDTKLLMYLLKD